MVYLFSALALGLLITAWVNWRERRRDFAAWFLFWALVNGYCGWHVIASRDAYAYRLHPAKSPGSTEPYMPDRR